MWPSGLRRWIKAPVSSGAWVRVPPKSSFSFCRRRCFSRIPNPVPWAARQCWPTRNALMLPSRDRLRACAKKMTLSNKLSMRRHLLRQVRAALARHPRGGSGPVAGAHSHSTYSYKCHASTSVMIYFGLEAFGGAVDVVHLTAGVAQPPLCLPHRQMPRTTPPKCALTARRAPHLHSSGAHLPTAGVG